MNLFETIPIEIQKEILGLCVTVKNLLSLKLVCKRFKKLVEEVYDPNIPEGKHFKWNAKHKNTKEVSRLLKYNRILRGIDKYGCLLDICCLADLQSRLL